MPGDLLIHDLGPLGDGIHRGRGGIVYVDRALPGERVEARVQRDREGILRGELSRVIHRSPQRIAAPCPHYEACGGCTLQHAREGFYRHWKVGLVREALRVKGLKPKVWREPVFLAAGDRRRATFAALRIGETVTLGNHRRRSAEVTDIAACRVVDPAVMAVRERLTRVLVALLAEARPALVFIQALNGHIDVVVTGPIGRSGTPDRQTRETIRPLARDVGLDRLSWRADVADEPEILVENTAPRARFGEIEVTLPPFAFLQPSQAGEDALVRSVMGLLPRAGAFADLFSGCGTFSGPMLGRGSVDAYENVGSAIRALDHAKGTRPLRAIHRDLFTNPLRRDEANRYDAIVFDPPRAGAQEQVRALAAGRTPLLVGVSCNPASFARDARILVDGGYRLASVRVVDQFTWSHHVELVAAFTKPRR